MNALAHQALLEHQGRTGAVAAHKKKGAAVMLRWVIVGAGAGLCILAAVLWLRAPVETGTDMVTADVAELPLPLPDPARVGRIEKQPTEPEPLLPEVPEPGAASPTSQPTVQPLPESAEAVATEPVTMAPAPPAATEVPVEPEPAPEPVTPVQPAPTVQPTQPEPAAPEPAQPAPVVGAPPAPAAPAAAPEPPLPPVQPVEPAPVAAAEAPPAAPAESPGMLYREAWIRQRDPDHYTLQLLGTRSEAAIHAFVKQHQLQGEMAYYSRTHKGSAWFTLIYGDYADRAAASAAVAELPAALRKAQPFPRSFASVGKQLDTP